MSVFVVYFMPLLFYFISIVYVISPLFTFSFILITFLLSTNLFILTIILCRICPNLPSSNNKFRNYPISISFVRSPSSTWIDINVCVLCIFLFFVYLIFFCIIITFPTNLLSLFSLFQFVRSFEFI